jgi:hypothetical protein
MNLRKLLNGLIVLTLLLPALLTGNPTPMRAASATSDAPTVVQKTLDCTGASLIQAEPVLPDQVQIYVDHDATGANNGDSWSNAYTDLQDALDDATGGEEIWVAEGVYTPTAGITRTATFTLVNGVTLYGGFAGTETTRDQRDWEAHVTVLSGDLDGNDTTGANGVITNTTNITGSNAYHVVIGGGVTETAVLDGFTVTGGQANGGAQNMRGSGMYNAGGSPTLTNVTFSGNEAGNGYGDGGGMYNQDNSNPTLTNVTFSDNTAGSGGGMYNDSSSPVLTSVTFSNNTGNGGGGGMYNTDDSHPALTYVTFSDNTTLGFGGGVCNFGSSPVLINVVFSGNGANFMAGGMYNAHSNFTLTNVIFSGNHASTLGGSLGGGMYNANSNLTLTNVTFSGNSTNSGGKGGGMYNSGSSLTLTNATFRDNRTGSDGSGGGMYNSDASNARLTNCILWGNSDGGGTGETAQITNDTSAITVTYSLIQSATVYTGTGNLNADPQFVGADNLRLRETSPAIDAGDNSAITVPFDLDGHPRRVDVPDVPDTGNGTAPIVDMGAYEASFHKIYLPVVLLKHG